MTAWRSTPGSAQERCARRASVNSLDGLVDTFAAAETQLRGPGTPFHAAMTCYVASRSARWPLWEPASGESRLNLDTVGFLVLSQFIIFLLGWPLEWTEIIIIFVPIFLPLLEHFGVDPIFFGVLVALNLQTSFLTPPMAMSAYYLKGIAPPQIQLMEIFRGCMPFLVMVFISMIMVYNFTGLVEWLPTYLYGG
jgi:hypothetical protein